MNFDQLRYFVELSRTGSLAKAARALFISPQGLNKAIGSLEEEVGVRLVERTRAGTALTKEGCLFLEFAQNSLEAHDDLLESFVRTARRRAPLHVGATSYVLHTLLRDLRDLEGAPETRIEEMTPSAIYESLCDPASHVRLHLTNLLQGSSLAKRIRSNFTFVPLVQTRFGVLAHRDFPFGSGDAGTDELETLPLVRYRDESIDWVMENAFGGRPPQNILLCTSSIDQLLHWVATKQAACLFDSFGFYRLGKKDAEAHEAFRFVEIEGMPVATIGLALPTETLRDERAQEFFDLFTSSLQQENAAYLEENPLDSRFAS